MFILSSISSGLEFCSVNHTSIYENYFWNFFWKVFKNIKLSDEISSNWPNDLLVTNVVKTLEFMLIMISDNVTMK